jgi:hypothetical protein
MTSFRQIEANRRNSLRSTGPRTEESKRQSRCNALRDGLTAETLIDGLENSEDYICYGLLVPRGGMLYHADLMAAEGR